MRGGSDRDRGLYGQALPAVAAARSAHRAGRRRPTHTISLNQPRRRGWLALERTKAAAELADLRVQLAGRQAEHAHVESEINTIRAIASAVGLGSDVGRAVHILAGGRFPAP
jgi:hypothetical protein